MAIGKAYGFFYYEAFEDEASRKPALGKTARDGRPRTWEGLELSIRDMNEFLGDRTTDPELVRIIKNTRIRPTFPKAYRHLREALPPANTEEIPYVVEATDRRDTGKPQDEANENAANNLKGAMRSLYDTYGQGKPYWKGITFKKGNEYIERMD